MTAHPFIKWAGGKRIIINEILSSIPEEFNDYYELFLGGGAVFYALYNKNLLVNKNIFINDLNTELITTYKVIKENPDKLIEALKLHKANHIKASPWQLVGDKEIKDPGGYYYQLRSKIPSNNVEIASRMIYLNRAGFNGLYRVNSKGEFNVPAGKYKNPDIVQEDNLNNAHIAFKNVNISNLSYDKLDPKKGDFVYLDPPYDNLHENSFTKYQKDDFGWEDQVKLFEYCKELDNKGVLWMYSNHATPKILELFKGYNIKILDVARVIASKAENRKPVKEVLITNY